MTSDMIIRGLILAVGVGAFLYLRHKRSQARTLVASAATHAGPGGVSQPPASTICSQADPSLPMVLDPPVTQEEDRQSGQVQDRLALALTAEQFHLELQQMSPAWQFADANMLYIAMKRRGIIQNEEATK